MEPRHKASELLDGFFVSFAPFFRAGELRITEHAGFGIAAGPRNERCGTGRKQIDPIERAVLFVEADGAALDLVFADVVTIEVEVERSFEFAGVRAAAGKFTLTPAREKGLVHREQVPPSSENALGVGLKIGAARNEIEIGHVGAVAVKEDDFFEAV